MPAHVLVVEDSQSQALRLKLELMRMGVAVEIAPSGDAGLRAARAVRPALIVLDIELPGIDGFSLCRALKSDPDTATIPVVMFTHREQLSDAQTALDLGADDYILKDAYAARNVIAALHHFGIL